MEQLQQMNMSWIEVQFMQKAVDKLMMVRFRTVSLIKYKSCSAVARLCTRMHLRII
jgi:hypothetical protein